MKINFTFKTVTEFSDYLHSESIEDPLRKKQGIFDSGKLLMIYGKGTASDAHTYLASILSTILGKPINYADLPTNFRGKPYLTDSSLHFSLSHTHDAFLLGVCRNQEIGIDLEGSVPPNELDSLAEYAFSPDERKLLDQHPNPESFLKIWTLKEAYLKATGIGLVDALPTLHVVSSPHFEILDQQYSSLHFLCPGNETGSIVCKGPMPEVFSINLCMK